MAKNFKIADIKPEARYTVNLIDKWDGTATTEEMDGTRLVNFTNACAHLYDIHVEEIPEPVETVEMVNIYDEIAIVTMYSTGIVSVTLENGKAWTFPDYDKAITRLNKMGYIF